MHTVQTMYTNIRRRFEQKFRRFCRPLKDFLRINQFYHYRLTHSGHYAVIGLHTEWEEYFFSEKFHLSFPYFRHPRYIESGQALPQVINEKKFKQVLYEGEKKFNVNLSLVVMEKTAEGVDAFGFGLASADLSHHLALYNELPLLRLFIEHFRQEFKGLSPAFDEYQVDFASAIGQPFYQPICAHSIKPSDRTRFLEQMGMLSEIPLSSQDKRTLRYLLDGYSAPHTAEMMLLSPRTVEHRLERLKEKFGCFSKTELIQKARLLEKLGSV